MNELIINEDGYATIIGALAHDLLFKAPDAIPRYNTGNNFYVFEFIDPFGALRWQMKDGYKTREEAVLCCGDGGVLVDVTNAPKSDPACLP